MERLGSINSQRILWCCVDRAMTPHQLADETGISRQTLSKVLETGGGLTFPQLQRIAQYFGRGVLFFFEETDATDIAVRTPQFRTLASQKPELSASIKLLIERVERQRDVYISLREDLADPDLPTFRMPDIPRDPVGAAAAVRSWLKLGERNTFDTYRSAIEQKGILVFRTNGYNGKWQIAKENPILGFAIFHRACPVIVVKKQDYESPQSFTLAHELGHLLMHQGSSIDDANDFYSDIGEERQANLFAGHLLVPDDLLSSIRVPSMPAEVSQLDEWLKAQRAAWGVSAEVIIRRLADAQKIERDVYVEYRAWRNSLKFIAPPGGVRMYRYREPKHIFGETFVRAVFESLNARQITLARASKYLDSLKISDIHQLERHYVGS